MFYDFVPEILQNDFDSLLNDLSYLPEQENENCPFCHEVNFYKVRQKPLIFRCKVCQKYFNPLTLTPFNRLTPSIWWGLILTRRVEKATYHTLAIELNCSIDMVKRRDHAIIIYMQQHYPALYTWYTKAHPNDSEMLPLVIEEQHKSAINLIHQLLTIEKIHCLYCQSTDTIKIGQRFRFRCKHCKKTFNLLHKTPLNKMPHSDLWLTFIDMLVNNQTNKAITEKLNLSHNTVTKWRRIWCKMMRDWKYEELAIWCDKKQ